MRITVIGGTGFAGANVVAEAARRGHEVTAWSRHEPAEPEPGVTYKTGSMLDEATLARAVEGAEVVIEALSPRGEMQGRMGPVVTKLARLAEDAGALRGHRRRRVTARRRGRPDGRRDSGVSRRDQA
jgi:putative NADH-flavin reductase